MNEPRTSSVRDAWRLTPAERMARFARLQQQAFEVLKASPEGWRRFWERNLKQRRVHWTS